MDIKYFFINLFNIIYGYDESLYKINKIKIIITINNSISRYNTNNIFEENEELWIFEIRDYNNKRNKISSVNCKKCGNYILFNNTQNKYNKSIICKC